MIFIIRLREREREREILLLWNEPDRNLGREEYTLESVCVRESETVKQLEWKGVVVWGEGRNEHYFLSSGNLLR